jgi:plastocyanin
VRNNSLFAAAALAALSCGGDNGPNEPGDTGGNGALTVSVGNNVFTPASLGAPVNSTVTWQWNSAGVAHNVTFQDGPASGDRTTGSFPRTFSAAGTYSYVCTIHAAEGMTGTVNVSAGGGGTGGGDDTGGGGGDPYP